MTDPSLNYQTVPPDRPTPTRTAAWISLLVLGILYLLAGTCMSLAMTFTAVLLTRAAMPSGVKTVLMITAIVMFVLTAGVGIAEIWMAFRVRKGSRAAMITGLVLTIVNASMILLLLIIGFIGMLSGPNRADPSMFFGILFYLLPLAANVWTAYILRRRPSGTQPASLNAVVVWSAIAKGEKQ